MTTLDVPSDVAAAVQPVLPLLERVGVSSLRVFSYHRPGEEDYWLAYAYIDGARKVVATPDLRHLPLAEQMPALVERLQAWLVECQGEDISPREAGMAVGMYKLDDQDYVRAARGGRRRK